KQEGAKIRRLCGHGAQPFATQGKESCAPTTARETQERPASALRVAQGKKAAPTKASESQEHRPFEAPLADRGKQGKQECLCHQTQEKRNQDPPSQNEDGAPGRSIV